MLVQRATLVKLGGSLITEKDQPDTPRQTVIRRLASEAARALPHLPEGLILGHGSGSFGHASAARHGTHRGLTQPDQRAGAVETQGRAAELHMIVVEALREVGIPAFSLAPSSSAVTEGGSVADFAVEPVAGALAAGLVPVLYGDVVVDRAQGVAILSTEAAFAAVASRLGARGWTIARALWLGETDGIYDSLGHTIPEVSARAPEQALAVAGGSEAMDVTGGMRHRLETALELARQGIPSWIGDGNVSGNLERALLGQEVEGTRVLAAF